MNLTNYQTLVFDCDGVVLNSNKVKTEAFYKAALPYGKVAAKLLVEYHVARGGISRYKKFEWFMREVQGQEGPDVNQLLDAYANEVKQGLLSCDIAEGLFELRKKSANANWLIASGGDQDELRSVFAERGLAELFDGGIFGSPDSKDIILSREIKSGNIRNSALFIGDSKYDILAAKKAKIDILFVNNWSEFSNHEEYCTLHSVPILSSLSSLL
jgi:phosphoglycolate phosphatase-like HAD superfamily hydrolase